MSATRFAGFCDQWVDAIAKVGLVAVPLYFNIHALYPFEPSKSTLLAATGTALLAIVLLRLVASGADQPGHRPAGRRGPPSVASPRIAALPSRFWRRLTVSQRVLLAAVGLFLLGQVLATATSIAPAVSWWGSVPRLQGTWQLLWLATAVGIVAWHLSRGDNARPNQLLAAILLGAVPVGLYAVGQRLHLDRIGWVWGMEERVGSTFGQHVFVSAYAAAILPLAIALLVERWRDGRQLPNPTVRPWAGLWSAVIWLVAGNLLLAGLIAGAPRFAQHWWPALPAIAAYGIVCLHVASQPVGRAVALLGLAALAVLHIAVLALALGRGPLLALLVEAALLAILFALRLGSRRIALTMGAAIAAVALALAALNTPALPLDHLRQDPSLQRLSPLAVPGSAVTIRSRLVAWAAGIRAWRTGPQADWLPDRWQRIRWLVGWGPETFDIAYSQTVTPAEFPAAVLRTKEDRAHNIFVDLLVASGMLGVASWLLMGLAVLGCGLVAVRRGPRPILACGLLAAFVGHMVEVQSAFVTAASGWLAWTVAAILLIQASTTRARSGTVGAPPVAASAPAPRRSSQRPRRRAPPRSLAQPVAWRMHRSAWSTVGALAATALLLGAAYSGWLVPRPYPALVLGGAWALLLTGGWALATTTVLPTAGSTAARQRRPATLGPGRLAVVGAVAIAALLLSGWQWRVVAADMYAKAGFQGGAPWPERAATLQLALRLAPTYDLYPLLLGEVLAGAVAQPDAAAARSASDVPDLSAIAPQQWTTFSPDGLAEIARQSFGRALELNGWRYDAYADLAMLEEREARRGGDTAAAQAAQQAYRRAVALRPSHLQSWLALAQLQRGDGDEAGAEVSLLNALAADGGHAPAHVRLGDLRLDLGRADQAWQDYRQALALDPGSWFDDRLPRRMEQALAAERGPAILDALQTGQPERDAASRRVYGYVLYRLEQWEAARRQFEGAVAGTPLDWWTQTHLALTLSRLGEMGPAKAAADAALRQAPAAQRAAVGDLLAGVRGG